MATSKMMQIVRSVNKGLAFFNDKLKDGTRSVKVWGWSEEDYNKAVEALQAAGYTVEKKVFKQYSVGLDMDYFEIRLHVQA